MEHVEVTVPPDLRLLDGTGRCWGAFIRSPEWCGVPLLRAAVGGTDCNGAHFADVAGGEPVMRAFLKAQ
jgi:hypothetical protein